MIIPAGLHLGLPNHTTFNTNWPKVGIAIKPTVEVKSKLNANLPTIARLGVALALVAASVAGLAGGAAAVPTHQPADGDDGALPDGWAGLDVAPPSNDDVSGVPHGFGGLDAPYPTGEDGIVPDDFVGLDGPYPTDDDANRTPDGFLGL